MGDDTGDAADIRSYLAPAEGWTEDRPRLSPAQMEELVAVVRHNFPDAHVDLLRRHLPNVFADAVSLQSIGKPNKKKVATHIRDEIETLVKHLQIAQERLASLDPLVVRFLDFELTSLNAGLAPSEDTPSVDGLTGELAERIMLLITILERVKPGTTRAGESGWAFTALATARLLRATTGQPLRRSYSASKGADVYWSLEFFQKFAAMVQDQVPEKLRSRSWGNAGFSDVWRRACDQANPET